MGSPAYGIRKQDFDPKTGKVWWFASLSDIEMDIFAHHAVGRPTLISFMAQPLPSTMPIIILGAVFVMIRLFMSLGNCVLFGFSMPTMDQGKPFFP